MSANPKIRIIERFTLYYHPRRHSVRFLFEDLIRMGFLRGDMFAIEDADSPEPMLLVPWWFYGWEEAIGGEHAIEEFLLEISDCSDDPES